MEDFPAFACCVIQSRVATRREEMPPHSVRRCVNASLAMLVTAMAGLSREEYSALMLRHRAELSQVDISAALGISPATVSRVLASAENRFVDAIRGRMVLD
jgi:DNA-directed RNA polymerase specialized sigma24 family protein